jgi:hypothetical protein
MTGRARPLGMGLRFALRRGALLFVLLAGLGSVAAVSALFTVVAISQSAQATVLTTCTIWTGTPADPANEQVGCTLTVENINTLLVVSGVQIPVTLFRTSATLVTLDLTGHG